MSSLDDDYFLKSNEEKSLGYLDALSSYTVCATALSGFCMALMFNFVAPINVRNYFMPGGLFK